MSQAFRNAATKNNAATATTRFTATAATQIANVFQVSGARGGFGGTGWVSCHRRRCASANWRPASARLDSLQSTRGTTATVRPGEVRV